jgi:glyoxylase-like metal-dependent hydrolase (beta-lactamase superfamily II)
VWAPRALLERRGGALSSLRAIGVGVPRSEREWIPVPAFLIEHPSAGPLLVDTGLHPAAPTEPKRTMGRVSNLLYKYRVAEGQTLSSQLGRLGLPIEDLKTVLMTHLHSDHAAGAVDLAGAGFLVDRREWRAANRPTGFLSGYYRPHLRASLKWRLLDFEGPEAEDFEGFRCIDLLGDGSIRLLSTPGHTAGHLSVLVRLAKRTALLAADAAYTLRTVSEGALPGIAHDLDQFRRSLALISEYLERSPETILIPGHDAALWSTLDSVYT